MKHLRYHDRVLIEFEISENPDSTLRSVAEAPRHHRVARRVEPLGEEAIEPSAGGIEGDLHAGVLRYLARAGAPNAFHEPGGSGRGEAHLVDPNVPGKPRRHRPFRRGVQASVHPILGRFDVDPGDLGDHPIGAVERYQRRY